MKKTLLEIVQDVLDLIEGDEVNSISDTIEAEQIVTFAENVYYQMLTNRDIPTRRSLIKVESLSDSSKPNYLKIPKNIDNVESVWYNRAKKGDTDTQYQEIPYVDAEEFLHRSYSYSDTAEDTQTVTDFSGVTILIKNSKAPSCWTSFDDEHLVFDAYDSEVDSTLQQSKTTAYAETRPEFRKVDDFVPDLPAERFPYFIMEVADFASQVMKQYSIPKVARQARKQKIATLKDRSHFSAKNRNKMPNKGRR